MCACVCTCMCHSTYVEVKGQLCGDGSLLLPLHGFWVLNPNWASVGSAFTC